MVLQPQELDAGSEGQPNVGVGWRW